MLQPHTKRPSRVARQRDSSQLSMASADENALRRCRPVMSSAKPSRRAEKKETNGETQQLASVRTPPGKLVSHAEAAGVPPARIGDRSRSANPQRNVRRAGRPAAQCRRIAALAVRGSAEK
jgi:hypothetical protein